MVTAQEAAFFAGTRDVYTPFSVEVDRVIRGDAHVGRMLVAVEGGTVGCYAVHVNEAPLVETGKRYVFFLGESVGAESARVFWDVWLVGADNVVQTAQGPMPLAELIDRIQRLPAPRGLRYPLTRVLSAALTRSSRPEPAVRSVSASRDAWRASPAE